LLSVTSSRPRTSPGVPRLAEVGQAPPGLPAHQGGQGPDPARADYNSFLAFSDPDGTGWLVQEARRTGCAARPMTPLALPAGFGRSPAMRGK